MTKRRLERTVDGLTDELLPELAVEDRIGLFVEAIVAGHEHSCEQLVNTCPRQTAPQFASGAHFAKGVADYTVYDLHTTALQYSHLEQVQQYNWALDLERDDDPSEDRLEHAVERADQMRQLFAQLYASYHANRRFAEEALGIDLRTWLALHPDGPLVLDLVETCLAESPWATPIPEWVREEAAKDVGNRDDTEPPDEDQLAADRFRGLMTTWNESLMPAASSRGH